MKYAWLDGHRKAYPLPALCTTLGVSISGYRAWKSGGRPRRKRLTDAQLLALIRAIHAELKGTARRGWCASCVAVAFQRARSGSNG